MDQGWRSGLKVPTLRQTTAPNIAAPVKTSKSYPSIDQEMRSHVDTNCDAFWLGRQSQTLRSWASTEQGPLRPHRIHGRLAWPVAEIKRLLSGTSKLS